MPPLLSGGLILNCRMCGKRVRKGRLVWTLDRAKALGSVGLDRRGSPTVFCSAGCLTERFSNGPVPAGSTGAPRPTRKAAAR